MAGFACRACGQCCRHVGEALASTASAPVGSVMHQAGAEFPHEVLADGSCSMLQADNSCGCYDFRPILCSVDRMFEALAIEGLSREAWYAINASACPPMP